MSRKNSYLALGIFLFTLFILKYTKCQASSNIYMSVFDENGALIEGPMPDGSIEIFGFEHSINVPYDETDWRLNDTGRIGKVYTTKEMDRTSPLLQNQLNNGRTLERVEFMFQKKNEQTLLEEDFFSIILPHVTC